MPSRLCRYSFSVLVVLFPFLTSCETLDSAGHSPHPIAHVVVCWLKNAGDTDGRNKLVAASQTFREIPGILSISAGPVLPGKRTGLDASFDVALVITFEDARALENYEKHPLHLQRVKDTLLPLVKKFTTYDFEIQNSAD